MAVAACVMSNTKPGHVTEPEASDKEGRDTLVTNKAGQATPRCQATTSIRQPSHQDVMKEGSAVA